MVIRLMFNSLWNYLRYRIRTRITKIKKKMPDILVIWWFVGIAYFKSILGFMNFHTFFFLFNCVGIVLLVYSLNKITNEIGSHFLKESKAKWFYDKKKYISCECDWSWSEKVAVEIWHIPWKILIFLNPSFCFSNVEWWCKILVN